MNRLFELIKAGVITMRLITLLIIGIAAYMWLEQMQMGETQKVITVMVIGFYFGGESFAHFSKYLLEKYVEHFEKAHRE